MGAAPIAKALWKAGCRTFFVSRVEEGPELRNAIGEATIIVLDGITGSNLDAFHEAALIPALNHPGEYKTWSLEAKRLGRQLDACLHTDTGMARLGFAPQDVVQLAEEKQETVRWQLVMSHLACADTPADGLNDIQLRRFQELTKAFEGVRRSFSNSAGVLLGRSFQFELCRPGIALFGCNPTPEKTNLFKPVVTVEAPVLQVNKISKSGTVGYGATYKAVAGTTLATLGVGYADGFMLAASHKHSLTIKGCKVPIAGGISMDLMTIDISNLPNGAIRPGDTVNVIDETNTVDAWAKAAGTISYEFLTRLGMRLNRHYIPAS